MYLCIKLIYILAANDYSFKWAKYVVLKEVKKEDVVKFMHVNIIFRYGIPRYITTNNGEPLRNKLEKLLCEKLKFKEFFSSMYYALANGLAKAFNKKLYNLLKKVIVK